ncbi:Zinc finger RAD18 domain-containing protein, partial [Stegodyphus mimosarum]
MDLEESLFNDSEDELFLKSIDEDLDFAFALSLQAAYDDDINENSIIQESASSSSSGSVAKPLSIVDEQWELIDPNPDIHSLFVQYDAKFFYGKLQAVEVKWSPRMTCCAGICCYGGRGRLCSIRLSMPLLKLRPR